MGTTITPDGLELSEGKGEGGEHGWQPFLEEDGVLHLDSWGSVTQASTVDVDTCSGEEVYVHLEDLVPFDRSQRYCNWRFGTLHPRVRALPWSGPRWCGQRSAEAASRTHEDFDATAFTYLQGSIAESQAVVGGQCACWNEVRSGGSGAPAEAGPYQFPVGFLPDGFERGGTSAQVLCRRI